MATSVPPRSAGTSAFATPPSYQRSDSRSDTYDSAASSTYDIFDEDIFPPKSQAYMNSLIPPSQENFERIALVQAEKEELLRQRDRELRHHALKEHRDGVKHADAVQRLQAAETIQKTFRGYRTRREMQGHGLDASTRWISAFREAQFRQKTRPKSSQGLVAGHALPTDHVVVDNSVSSRARENWSKLSVVARRAGHDDIGSDESSLSSLDEDATSEDKEKHRRERERLVANRRHEARMMGLQYFLEMVDAKHRYGSNLRMYHEQWKKSDTRENYFYWLDYGEGKNIELEACPRDRLEREQIRYLSREERQLYLVKADNNGLLRWVRTGSKVDTTNQYKDSINGIVPADDPTPAYNPIALPPSSPPRSSSESSRSSHEATREADRAAKYTNSEMGGEHGVHKVSHVSMTTIWNKMLRKSVRSGTWIFVADTSFRLYVGIKNSGAFQHSSFLQGSRISAAGLIKVKEGRITSLSPLSGHYRPPASNFRAFVRSLKDGGVDMSRVSISKSYIVLAGLEAYVKTRRKGKKMLGKLVHGKEKITAPEEVKQREEEAKDKSKSAQRERQVLEEEERQRDANSTGVRVMQKLRLSTPEGDLAAPTRENYHGQIESEISMTNDVTHNEKQGEYIRNDHQKEMRGGLV